jgi:hypothetical protein
VAPLKEKKYFSKIASLRRVFLFAIFAIMVFGVSDTVTISWRSYQTSLMSTSAQLDSEEFDALDHWVEYVNEHRNADDVFSAFPRALILRCGHLRYIKINLSQPIYLWSDTHTAGLTAIDPREQSVIIGTAFDWPPAADIMLKSTSNTIKNP